MQAIREDTFQLMILLSTFNDVPMVICHHLSLVLLTRPQLLSLTKSLPEWLTCRCIAVEESIHLLYLLEGAVLSALLQEEKTMTLSSKGTRLLVVQPRRDVLCVDLTLGMSVTTGLVLTLCMSTAMKSTVAFQCVAKSVVLV